METPSYHAASIRPAILSLCCASPPPPLFLRSVRCASVSRPALSSFSFLVPLYLSTSSPFLHRVFPLPFRRYSHFGVQRGGRMIRMYVDGFRAGPLSLLGPSTTRWGFLTPPWSPQSPNPFWRYLHFFALVLLPLRFLPFLGALSCPPASGLLLLPFLILVSQPLAVLRSGDHSHQQINKNVPEYDRFPQSL